MADLEFVIEAPHVARTNKKRPRLVTSCDHWYVWDSSRSTQHWLTPKSSYSRAKKIKCIQQPATGKCEACISADLPCLYRDREQYFAERTRMLSGAGSAIQDASTSGQNRAHLSAINASSPSSSRGPTPPHSSRGASSVSSSPDRSYSPSLSYGMGIHSLDIQPTQTFAGGSDSRSSIPMWCARSVYAPCIQSANRESAGMGPCSHSHGRQRRCRQPATAPTCLVPA